MDLGLSGSMQPFCNVLTNLFVFKKLEKSHDYLQQINQHKKGSDFRVIFALFGQQNSLILFQAEAPL